MRCASKLRRNGFGNMYTSEQQASHDRSQRTDAGLGIRFGCYDTRAVMDGSSAAAALETKLQTNGLSRKAVQNGRTGFRTPPYQTGNFLYRAWIRFGREGS